jgi:toxin ParE1/3/4
MQIRWSPGAAEDLDYIFNYIARDSIAAAQRVAKSIYDRAGTLAAFPCLGRAGRVRGTRELSLTPLPFIVVYRVLDPVDAVEIVSVIHGAQRWPPMA